MDKVYELVGHRCVFDGFYGADSGDWIKRTLEAGDVAEVGRVGVRAWRSGWGGGLLDRWEPDGAGMVDRLAWVDGRRLLG